MADATGLDAPMVPWVIGTQRALARSLATTLATERGLRWERMTPAARDRLTDDAEATIKAWVGVGAARTFMAEWKEPR